MSIHYNIISRLKLTMTSIMKITSFAVVMAFALSIGISGMPEADAKAVDEKLVKFAKQYEKVQEKIEKATGDKKDRLEQESNVLLNFLNRQGLATEEQWNEDPTYWIELRMDVVERENASKKSSTDVSQIVYSGNSQITPMCGCSDALELSAGYAVYFVSVWWPNTVSTATIIPENQQGYSEIEFNDWNNDYVKPYQYTQSKSAVKEITYNWEYVAHDHLNDEMATDDNDGEWHYYALLVSTYEETMGQLTDVPNGSEFRFDVEVTDISSP